MSNPKTIARGRGSGCWVQRIVRRLSSTSIILNRHLIEISLGRAYLVAEFRFAYFRCRTKIRELFFKLRFALLRLQFFLFRCRTKIRELFLQSRIVLLQVLIFVHVVIHNFMFDDREPPNESSSPTAALNAVNGGQTKKETKCKNP